MKNEIIWVKSKWTRDELNQKTVEFRFRLRDTGAIATGTGRFNVLENPDRFLSVFIDCHLPGRTPNEFVCQRFFVLQTGAEAIAKHKTGLKDFECFPPL